MKEFSFGSGVIVGTLSKADFFLGKTKIDNILFYEILAEQSITGDFGDLEGIIGLGPASVSPTPNFFDYLVEQKNLSQIFSVYLNREEDKKKSKIIFGSIPENLFKGSPKYYNINDEYYWAIDMEAIFVGDRDTKLCSKENKCKAVMDTGTSFLASSTKNIMQIASFSIYLSYK